MVKYSKSPVFEIVIVIMKKMFFYQFAIGAMHTINYGVDYGTVTILHNNTIIIPHYDVPS